MAAPKRVLQDHKRVGSKFIPPFVQQIPLQEVSHVKRVVPEILWIAVLTEMLGMKPGTDASVEIARAAARLDPTGHFCLCSNFNTLSQSQKSEMAVEFAEKDYVSRGLAPLVALYPACPLAFLCREQDLSARDQPADIRWLTDLLPELFDKDSVKAVQMQAGAVYIEFLTDKLKVNEGLALAQFPEVEKYPNTELSQRVAASIRSALKMFVGQLAADEEWPRYFWNRGGELSDCVHWGAE